MKRKTIRIGRYACHSINYWASFKGLVLLLLSSIFRRNIFLILILAYSNCIAQQQFVQSFYQEGKDHGLTFTQPVNIIIEELNSPTANGRIDDMPDGSFRIVIDKVFMGYYGGEATQTKRLIYYLLAHKLLNMGPGKRLMDADRIYKGKLKYKHINEIYENNKRNTNT